MANHKTIKWVIMVLAMLIPAGCIHPGDVLLHRAARDAADRFVTQVMQNSRWDQVHQIGVFSIDNDTHGQAMRETLHSALIRHTRLTVVGMDEMAEKEKNLETLGRQLKYQKNYDAATLAAIGRMIGVKTLVTGRIIDQTHKFRSGNISFSGQVLDLEKGTILWAENVDGRYFEPLNAQEIAGGVFGGVLLLVALFWLSRVIFWDKEWEGARGARRKQIFQMAVLLVAVSGISLYFLVLA
jgi:TolB-like protein